MKVEQIHDIMNAVTQEVLGNEAILKEDLSNIVDVGKEILDATSVDNYVKSLVDRIGKVVFVSRPYSGNVPSIMMDSFEYGAVVEKISADLPTASENSSWDLVNGKDYSPNVFYKPSVSAKFFHSRVTFEIDLSFTERQVKDSFASAGEVNAFLTMLYNAVDKALTVKVDHLIMQTLNAMTAETLWADLSDPSDGENQAVDMSKTGLKAVNLLKLYNDKFGTSLTVDKAITDPEFIRFASMQMALYIDRLSKLSTLFNIGGKDRFTSKDMLHIVMLSEFKAAANSYLQSETFHNEFTALPEAETVPYWQGPGKDYDFGSVSAINVETASGAKVSTSGILALMFDREACGVTNLDRRVTTNYNPKAEFYNNFFKFESGYFNDQNENYVVFFVGEGDKAATK